MIRTGSLVLVSTVVGISLFTLNALGAANIPAERTLILDSFGRDVAPFNAAASALRTTLAQELGEPVDFYQDRPPLGSIVEFRRPTIWERYKWPIILVLGLCALEAALISVLLRERR